MRKQAALRYCFLVVLVYTVMSSQIPFAQESMKTTSRSGFIKTPDGVRIHYLEAGPRAPRAKAPAILFVPGWTMPAEIWEAQITYFSKTRRVVAMDPRSQGQSSQAAEGNYPEARARDIKALVDQLKLAPVALVGWSMGVADATGYVNQFGTDSLAALVLVDGFVDWMPVERLLLDMAADLQRDRTAATAEFVRGMYKTAQSEDYLQRITRAALRTPTNTALALLFSLLTIDRRPALSKINKPTLVVVAQGSGPFMKMFEEMQKGIAGSRLVVFEKAGHALFVDQSDRFNTLLDEFLKAAGN